MKTLIYVFRILIIASRFRHAGWLSALQIAWQSVGYRRCGVVLDVMKQVKRVESHVPYALLPAPKGDL
jgi:hypothetical protein